MKPRVKPAVRRARPERASARLTHLDERGAMRMVDVGGKDETQRVARATARVRMSRAAQRALVQGNAKKGDVLGAARLAGIQAAKQTSALSPLCHALQLTKVSVEAKIRRDGVELEATVSCTGRTGVEMEALTAVSVAALTVYDMLKAVDRGMVIEGVRLLEKRGGKSGDYRSR